MSTKEHNALIVDFYQTAVAGNGSRIVNTANYPQRLKCLNHFP
ncbi:hypothetical protein GPAL_1853 [Glaciecola pallidula DSM 14239 = ACAM 615]|uniref:Uncharacterized protein n=1 Tax=Brumicola pallidula DSM 14239 = ACAM 615 TaxID=1121922 RepID=K6ZZK1_9ALTE|nr:hypothetical protein GPAL_1853 [Glaciecola pallidula DSM 14239 = ACAM 615]